MPKSKYLIIQKYLNLEKDLRVCSTFSLYCKYLESKHHLVNNSKFPSFIETVLFLLDCLNLFQLLTKRAITCCRYFLKHLFQIITHIYKGWTYYKKYPVKVLSYTGYWLYYHNSCKIVFMNNYNYHFTLILIFL